MLYIVLCKIIIICLLCLFNTNKLRNLKSTFKGRERIQKTELHINSLCFQLMVHLRAGRLGPSVRPLVTVVFNNISVSVHTVPRPLMESLALATQVRLETVALTSVQVR